MPRPSHFEIPVDNPERAIAFYSAVFGWTFHKWEGAMPYWLITTGPNEGCVAGGLAPGATGGGLAFPVAFGLFVVAPAPGLGTGTLGVIFGPGLFAPARSGNNCRTLGFMLVIHFASGLLAENGSNIIGGRGRSTRTMHPDVC